MAITSKFRGPKRISIAVPRFSSNLFFNYVNRKGNSLLVQLPCMVLRLDRTWFMRDFSYEKYSL